MPQLRMDRGANSSASSEPDESNNFAHRSLVKLLGPTLQHSYWPANRPVTSNYRASLLLIIRIYSNYRWVWYLGNDFATPPGPGNGKHQGYTTGERVESCRIILGLLKLLPCKCGFWKAMRTIEACIRGQIS